MIPIQVVMEGILVLLNRHLFGFSGWNGDTLEKIRSKMKMRKEKKNLLS